MIAFIDTEVNCATKQVQDYGAVRDDGAQLHTHSAKEFDRFINDCNYLCGHNIVHFDLKHLYGEPATQLKYKVIDTLYLSPLLFPQKPYHRLVKDDKLQVDELNNPLNDAIKARDLFHDEEAAYLSLSNNQKSILLNLLHNEEEFRGFFDYITQKVPIEVIGSQQALSELIRKEYNGRICSHAEIEPMISQHPVELAYALSIIKVDEFGSITPPWVTHTYPKVASVLHTLCGTPCGTCDYCRQKLDAHAALGEFFGYREFRRFDGIPMQQQAVESAIRRESLLCIFPTGGGKSLTFQLPALVAGRNEHGLTVVISPLQSLMKDQVDNLIQRGISTAVTLNGLLNPIERASAITQVSEGTAHLLYIAPEMLRNKTIERLLMGRNVARFVIDEAHCFSAWGQDFRVDYLYIGDFIRQLQEKKQLNQPIPVSCFTATAKPKVVADIKDYFQQKLGLQLRLFTADAERKNLRYSVIRASSHEEKYNQLRTLLLGHSCPSIVYCSRTHRTLKLAEKLRNDGIRALPFNGKMESADKIANQEAFMNGEAQVIVATSAFGMGVDKKDVGCVIHYDISDSLENYIQEAGRAGRDPQMQAECYVLYSDNDLDKHFILLNQTKLSLSEIQQVWQAVKNMTPQRPTINCSALEIARQAGWDENMENIETRVRAALAALENAGFLVRGTNTSHIFATGITVNTMNEARQRLMLSPLFDDDLREQAARIIKSLISRRTTQATSLEAESRIDYLADILGMNKEVVINCVNLMRQEGLLADTQDMQAWVERANLKRLLNNALRLEQFLLQQIVNGDTLLNYKQVNQLAQESGIKECSPRRLRILLAFLSIKGYIRKQEHAESESVSIQPLLPPERLLARFHQRSDMCRHVVETLGAEAVQQKAASGAATPHLITFSLIELFNQYNASRLSFDLSPTLAAMQETLLYLSRNDILKIDGGFMVIYNSMCLQRKAERRTRYGREQYRMLDAFYQQRMQQIHIVGEYANMMVRDYEAALRYVHDYFTMDYRQFINHYFRGERRNEITKNITPAKYRQLFGTLSTKQREIINDNASHCIVVAAGPGSGKTRTLVHKLASLLLLEDVKHEQLLMLTFSRAAATEFMQRLIELVGNAAHFVDIKTFHSYAFDLLGQLGSLEEADHVVQRAAEMIANGEVEEKKISKSVLVIDEAQDMGTDDFLLVQTLMQRNEEMRVIAVGDDDQNIYQFRGSNSDHMRSLLRQPKSVFYEMTSNYRSDRAIVNFANQFVQHIPQRMKTTPIEAASSENGKVDISPTIDWQNQPFRPDPNGTTAILTLTNEEALQSAYKIEQQGLHPILIQSTDGFRFINLAEVRFFMKQLSRNAAVITDKEWQQAKQRTEQVYERSRLLDTMRRFWHDYEQTHRTRYRTDLRQFLLESNIEDFLSLDRNSIFVSTIHKAKGREFDTVHLRLDSLKNIEPATLRTLYVGMTRARHHLHIYTDSPLFGMKPQQWASTTEKNIVIALSMHDVYLHFFINRKAQILNLRSGDELIYHNGYFMAPRADKSYGRLAQPPEDRYVALLSVSMRQRIADMEKKGYRVIRAMVSYVLAWRPRTDPQEVAVLLANIYLQSE